MYLYSVNRQIGYITSAHLILFSIAASYFFISKVSSASNNQDRVRLVDVNAVNEIRFSKQAAKGKTLFGANCASCHHVVKRIVGPPLAGFENRGPWSDRKELYKWIRQPQEYMKKDPYILELKKRFDDFPMLGSPHLTDQEIDFMVAYVNEYATQAGVP